MVVLEGAEEERATAHSATMHSATDQQKTADSFSDRSAAFRSSVAILVDGDQLEALAQLGFRPRGSDESGGLVMAHTPAKPSNPHPTRGPGATDEGEVVFEMKEEVSIRTRPEGRVRPALIGTIALVPTWFQSSPDRKAGCDPSPKASPSCWNTFQSSPDRKAGCDEMEVMDCFRMMTFQSSPDRKAGCDHDRHTYARVLPVSILTRPEGRVRRSADHERGNQKMFQSSPDRKAGCDQRPVKNCRRPQTVSIRTRPEGRVRPR